jgi:hypothetical protein
MNVIQLRKAEYRTRSMSTYSVSFVSESPLECSCCSQKTTILLGVDNLNDEPQFICSDCISDLEQEWEEFEFWLNTMNDSQR